MPSSSFRTTSDGTPRMVEVTGATVTVDKYTTALLRVSTRTGLSCRAWQTGRAELRLGLFFWPRGLRFPTRRFRVGFRLSRVALAVARFTDAQFQPTEIFPQGVAHQSGPISSGALRGLVGGVTASYRARFERFP